MEHKNYEIDKLDLQILSILMGDAKIPYTRIGEMLFVSPGTIHVRMKKMENMGLVKRHQLMINHEKLGYDVTAFLGIYLERSALYREVVKELKTVKEVISAHYTTGTYSIFAKVVCRDTNHLREVLYDKIQHISGIHRTETFISLEESINRPITLLKDKDRTYLH